MCSESLGAEDYINIAKICNHIFIEEIPKFNNENSNQQLRFITLIDILYEQTESAVNPFPTESGTEDSQTESE